MLKVGLVLVAKCAFGDAVVPTYSSINDFSHPVPVIFFWFITLSWRWTKKLTNANWFDKLKNHCYIICCIYYSSSYQYTPQVILSSAHIFSIFTSVLFCCVAELFAGQNIMELAGALYATFLLLVSTTICAGVRLLVPYITLIYRISLILPSLSYSTI